MVKAKTNYAQEYKFIQGNPTLSTYPSFQKLEAGITAKPMQRAALIKSFLDERHRTNKVIDGLHPEIKEMVEKLPQGDFPVLKNKKLELQGLAESEKGLIPYRMTIGMEGKDKLVISSTFDAKTFKELSGGKDSGGKDVEFSKLVYDRSKGTATAFDMDTSTGTLEQASEQKLPRVAKIVSQSAHALSGPTEQPHAAHKKHATQRHGHGHRRPAARGPSCPF